ncbi:MAG: hypothetical protein HKL80_10330 [Acidimicrobiales bacterium]|nr:hypothetical protein [Acidimicrobiales bacterium]
MFTFSLSGLEIKASDSGPIEVEENETTARSAVYMVLGSFFAPPGDSHFDKAVNDHWEKEMTEAASLLPFEFDTGHPTIDEATSKEAYIGEYDRLFSSGDRLNLLVASQYSSDPENLMAQVKRDYEYFGLGGSESSERPIDHLASECDFLQYLCFKEAASPSPRLAGSYRRAQRDFLERHLISWVPDIVAKVTPLNPIKPYDWALSRLNDFIQADYAYIKALLGG